MEEKKKYLLAAGGLAALVGIGAAIDNDETKTTDDPTNVAPVEGISPLKKTQKLMQKAHKSHEEKNKKGGQIPKIEEIKEERIELSAEDLAKKVHVKYESGTNNLDIQTITHIMELSVELAQKDFVDFTIENRKKRRDYRKDNLDRYEEFISEYQEKIEDIITKSQNELLEAMGVSQITLEHSMNSYIQRGYVQEIYMLAASQIQKVKDYLPRKNIVDLAKAKEIFSYQIKILDSEVDLFKEIIGRYQGNPEIMSKVPMVIGSVVTDLVYEKFGIEEEELLYFMRTPYANDRSLVELIGTFEQKMQMLVMSNLGMPGMMGGGMGMEGMEGMFGPEGMEGMGGMEGMWGPGGGFN